MTPTPNDKPSIPSPEHLNERIELALKLLLERDSFLIDIDANERSISHHLAVYIKLVMPAWDIDCEYNRNGHGPKVTHLPVGDAQMDDEHARTVYPDIIVHLRNTNANLLAIEVKKSSSGIAPDYDLQKLASYCREPLSYQYGLFLMLRTRKNMDEPWHLEWFPKSKFSIV